MSKVALVTGATGGIGGVVVDRLLTEGYRVLAFGRNRQKLEALAARRPQGAITFAVLDLLQQTPSLLTDVVESTMGGPGFVALLVCAHGHGPVLEPSATVSAQTFRAVYETDVLGTLKMAQAVYPLMREQGGSMVFVSSLHAVQTYPGRAAYASAKAAVCGLMRTMALECGPQCIRSVS
jgi:NAD(P)-dependent dehydrogenase (short-subunit alcohol dehydrogenase family)